MKNLCPVLLFVAFFLVSCTATRTTTSTTVRPDKAIKSTVVLRGNIAPRTINTKNISANELVSFAETLVGYPYKWGGTNTTQGFDCSGLVTYVFSKFKIPVPRMSKEFTNAGTAVSTLESRRGDLILFTGNDAKSGVVGHMGIVTRNDRGIIQFIHAASGPGGGVTLSGMNPYFIPRFVKVIRIFNEPIATNLGK